jgi:NitT/TauT family transport system substrate-binding protein
MMPRKSPLVMVLLAFVVVTSSCAPAAAPTPTAAPSPTPVPPPTPLPKATLKVIFSPDIALGPLFIAQEEGYFAEQGIEIEWVTLGSVTEALPLLAQGSLDVGGGTPAAGFFNAIARGMNLKVVGGAGNIPGPEGCSPFMFVLRKALADSGEVKTIADLKGRKVALNTKGATPHYHLGILLEKAGLTLNDIELVILPFPDSVAALKQGAVDAAMLPEPLLSQALAQSLAVPLVKLNEQFPGYTMLFEIFGPNLLNKNPDLGKRFMVAVLKGMRQFRQGKTDRNAEIIAQHTRMDKAIIKQACWVEVDPNGASSQNLFMDTQDWFIKNGFQDQRVTAEQLFDNRFIEYAVNVVGKK